MLAKKWMISLWISISMGTIAYADEYHMEIFPEMQTRVNQAIKHQVQSNLITQEKLEQINQHLDSEAWQAQQSAYQSQILNVLEQSTGESNSDELNNKAVRFNHHPILFISASIPLTTLRRYAHDLAKIDGVMILRGGIDGLNHLSPTIKFAANVLKHDPSCQGQCQMQTVPILIDPLLFRENSIQAVPALMLTDGIDFTSHCEDSTHDHPSHDVTYGDASITGLLEELYALSDDQSIEKLIEVLS